MDISNVSGILEYDERERNYTHKLIMSRHDGDFCCRSVDHFIVLGHFSVSVTLMQMWSILPPSEKNDSYRLDECTLLPTNWWSPAPCNNGMFYSVHSLTPLKWRFRCTSVVSNSKVDKWKDTTQGGCLFISATYSGAVNSYKQWHTKKSFHTNMYEA